MSESRYQAKLVKKIETLLPGVLICKMDTDHIQGLPDLLILHKNRWAALEVKVSEKAKAQPNQQHYVDRLDNMSYASFIYPENEEAVLDALQSTLEPHRPTRISKSKQLPLD